MGGLLDGYPPGPAYDEMLAADGLPQMPTPIAERRSERVEILPVTGTFFRTPTGLAVKAVPRMLRESTTVL
ncbi:MAG: hypothetical protein AUI14_17355 [Actinobacteria bacterium 13_2_20CM_2_71_6]|nr:MAG: hypothetical protein AUI14_17355 [Actinobacteria bacterium 13_2_20CM_2_71_6]